MFSLPLAFVEALGDITVTLTEIWQKLKTWRAAATTAVTALAAAVAWLSGQVTSMRGTIDDLSRPTAEVRLERSRYLDELKTGFAADDDPRKGEFLNDIVYRVRMQTMTGPVGADLLCWLAARADSVQPDVGAVDGATTSTIVSFLDHHSDVFPLKRKVTSGWSLTNRTENVAALTYCEPYLATQRAPGEVELSNMRSPMTEVSHATNAETPPPPVSQRLFVQVADDSQKDGAQSVAAALGERFPTLIYQGTERIGGYAGLNEVRYYKPDDEGAAQAISNALACDGHRPKAVPVRGYETNPLVRTGTLELWIRKDTAQCVTTGEPAPD